MDAGRRHRRGSVDTVNQACAKMDELAIEPCRVDNEYLLRFAEAQSDDQRTRAFHDLTSARTNAKQSRNCVCHILEMPMFAWFRE
jgi:hypothetical protein